MSAPRVLITGRYGFTGHYAAKELEGAGWDVWGTGINPAPEPDPKYLEADLTNARSLEQVVTTVAPDAVLHLAGVAFVAHGRAESFYQVNLMGTRCLLDVLATTGHGSKAVVLVSSANVYGNASEAYIPETARPAPVNEYAVSKLAMEHMARMFDDRLPIVIARPFNYTGRGQDPKFLVPKIVSHFSQKQPQVELGNLDVARDFSDVRDVARMYRLLLENTPRGETVNICSGKATVLGEILDMCRTITGHDIEVVSNPAFARANEIKVLRGDPSHLESLISVGVRHSLEETLRWMLNS